MTCCGLNFFSQRYLNGLFISQFFRGHTVKGPEAQQVCVCVCVYVSVMNVL